MPQSQQPQQTDYQGYARNYNNQNQNPLIAQAEQPQQYYNRSEYPFLRDDISALTESDLGSDFISSYDPKFAQVFPSSINSQHSNINPENALIHSLNSENLNFSAHPLSVHTLNSMNSTISSDSIPTNALNRQALIPDTPQPQPLPNIEPIPEPIHPDKIKTTESKKPFLTVRKRDLNPNESYPPIGEVTRLQKSLNSLHHLPDSMYYTGGYDVIPQVETPLEFENVYSNDVNANILLDNPFTTQNEKINPIQQSESQALVIPSQMNPFDRKEHLARINARHKEKFEKKKEENPEHYKRKEREAELKNSIKEIKKEIDRLNEIQPEFMLSGDARKLNTLETQYANYQSELKYGSPELAVSQIQDILNEIVYGENPSGKERTNKYRENSYLKKEDMIKLNMLRALNGKRHHAKPIPIEQAKQEIESLIKIIRKIKPSQKKEEPQNRRFGANISTISGMKKDDDEELYMKDRSTKK